MRKIMLLGILLYCFQVMGQEVFPGGIYGVGGSYNLTYPPELCPDPGNCNFDLYNLIGGGNTAAMSKGSTYPGPFQTHNWWNSALWNVNTPACVGDITTTENMHSNAMYPIPPMIIEAESYGISLRYRPIALNGGGPNNTGNFFADEDIVFGFNGATCSRTDVVNYGDMHVTLEQDMGGGNKLYTTASQGSPYIFFERQGTAEPTFFLFFLKATAVSTSGNSITFDRSCCPAGTNPHFGKIALFFPPGTTISNDGINYIPLTTIPTNGSEYGGNNRYWRIRLPAGVNHFTTAIMPDGSQETLDLYEQYAFNKITDTRFTYSYDEATATLTSTFDFITTNVLGNSGNESLLVLYLHQYLYSPQYPANSVGLNYSSSRGYMEVITGNQFSTVMKNYGLLPALGWANTADSIQLYNLVQTFADSRNYINTNCGDPVYGALGALHECARIAEIAHAVGNYAARDKLLNIAKEGIERWLTSPDGEYTAMYHYDKDFNWLTPFPSAFDADRLLQDSHFHHGYLIYAAAIVARFESVLYNSTTWATEWGPMIEVVIRNINDYRRDMTPPANPDDVWFPYLRYFDPYAGHSWAGHDASNQESVSEAINFAAGAVMWGETTGNTAIRDMGLMMYITETEAARMYWWDGARRGLNNGFYAPNYAHYHGAILAPGGVAYATFFGANPHYMHGITYVPITGSSIWMGVDPAGAANNHADFEAAFGGPTDGSGGFWSSVMLMQQAVYDAATAKTRFLNEAIPNNWSGPDYDVEGLYWITTFDSVGRVDASVQADVASFAVFKKDGCRHYMIYNAPGKGERMVNFSDGQSFLVPADTIVTYRVCGILPVRLTDFYGKRNAEVVDLFWSTSSEKDNEYFILERSIDGKNFIQIARVKGMGNSSSMQHYFYKDVNPHIGMNYYRLRQADTDGKESISRVISVNFDASITFSIIPNPTDQLITISFNESSEYSISLHSSLGQMLFERDNVINSEQIDLSEYPSGMYMLKVIDKETGAWKVEKVLKK
ncbi:MAG TPA: glycosyl hydrolase [Cytophagaceae bacterium]